MKPIVLAFSITFLACNLLVRAVPRLSQEVNVQVENLQGVRQAGISKNNSPQIVSEYEPEEEHGDTSVSVENDGENDDLEAEVEEGDDKEDDQRPRGGIPQVNVQAENLHGVGQAGSSKNVHGYASVSVENYGENDDLEAEIEEGDEEEDD
jgi:hypothetical protein